MKHLTRLSLLLTLASLAPLPAMERDRQDRRPTLREEEEGRSHQGRKAQEPEGDDATARRQAMKEWFGEWTPEYRQFVMDAAAREREVNGSLIPGSGHFMPVKVAGNNWTNIGPTNADSETNGSTLYVRDSGRPVTILVDPTDANIIYNATAGGGVWKTTNGGSTWTAITESLGSLSCGYLAMDPSNHNTLYLGLGDAFDGTGIGLFKSTNGGSTWSSAVYLGSSSSINHIGVSSSDPNVVLVATDLGLFRSTNGGTSFSPITLGTTSNPLAWSIAKGTGTNWAITVTTGTDSTSGSYNGVKVFYSTDDGATWTASTGFAATGGRTSLASSPSNGQIMFAMVASDTDTTGKDLQQLYRSSNGGQTWTSLGLTATKKYSNTNTESSYVNKILNGQGWYNHFIAVDPSDNTSNTVWIGGALLACKITSALGTPVYTQMTNWLAQYSLPYVHADFHAGTFDQNGTLYVGTDGGLFKRTSSANNTWTSDLNIGITSHLIYSVGSSANNTSAVIGGFQDNGTRVRSGSTSTFNQQIGGDGFGSHIHATDATKMLGSLYYTRVYKSTNSGSTFSSASSGITESNNSSSAPFTTRITPFTGDATGNTVLTHVNTKVYKSTDYAATWSALGTSGLLVSSGAASASGSIRNVGVAKSAASAATVGVVCSGGRVYVTTNGGTSWVEKAGLEAGATTMPGSGGFLSNISFSPQDSTVIYVCSVNASSTANHVWKSTNGGTSWSALDGSAGASNGFPFGVPVNTVVEDPNDNQTVYAGTHLGVYRSTNGGATWSRFGASLPLVNVTDFYISPTSNLMRISTFGRGFWEFNTNTATVAASIATPASDVTVDSGQSVVFSGSASDADPASTLTYGWTFGDGGSDTGTSTSHSWVNNTGSDQVYTVTFTATGSTGGIGTATRSITVHTADAAAPTVSGTVTGQKGNITFNATASDNVGVSKVEFYVDGTLKGTDTTSPFSLALDSTTLTDGAHNLVLKAYDAANNVGTSATVPFSTDNTPPTLTVGESGTSGTLTFTANANDNIGVTQVTYYVDGTGWRTSYKAPFTAALSATYLSNGSHTLQGRAWDAAGNLVISPSVSFSVNNGPDAIPPTISVSESGTSGTLSLLATTSDNIGVVHVNYYIDGILWRQSTVPPFTCTLPSSALMSGSHSLVGKAFDNAGNTTSSAAYPFTVDNGVDTVPPTISIGAAVSSGNVNFTSTVGDNRGVVKVTYVVDGVAWRSSYWYNWSAVMPASNLSSGSHTVVGRVWDLVGNMTTSAPVVLNIP